MNEIKYTTKKTNLAYLIAGCVESIILVIVGIYCKNLQNTMISSWRFDLADAMNTASILIFVFAFVNILYVLMGYATYADVYDSKIIGKGLQKLNIRDFDLSFDKITDISCTGRFLNINTAAGSYKIVTNSERAKEILDYYSSAKH